MNEKDLMNLKDEISEAKQELSELKGQEKTLLNQLKTEWGCSSEEQAKK